jgi:hypothetical protein
MNKIFGMFVVSSLSVFLSGCTQTKETFSKTTEKPSAIVPNGSKEECMTGCVMLWKGSDQNSNKTEEQMNTYCNSICDSGQGMQNLDISSCDKSVEGGVKDTCYSEVAKKTNNAELCAKVKTETFAGSCYRTIAENTKDISLCEKITISYIKSSCITKLTSK